MRKLINRILWEEQLNMMPIILQGLASINMKEKLEKIEKK